jgi:hypothetical protein
MYKKQALSVMGKSKVKGAFILMFWIMDLPNRSYFLWSMIILKKPSAIKIEKLMHG